MPLAPYDYRADPAVPHFADDRPIIIFDGKCVLCSSFARFVLRADRDRRFRFLAAQTPVGTALYKHFGLDPVDYETNILLADGEVFLKSEGSLRILARLPAPWPVVAFVGRLVPRHCATVCTILSRAIACNGSAAVRPATCPTRRTPIASLPDGDGHCTARGESLDLCPHLASPSAAVCDSSISTRVFSV